MKLLRNFFLGGSKLKFYLVLALNFKLFKKNHKKIEVSESLSNSSEFIPIRKESCPSKIMSNILFR
jgi:hypothetical protein